MHEGWTRPVTHILKRKKRETGTKLKGEKKRNNKTSKKRQIRNTTEQKKKRKKKK